MSREASSPRVRPASEADLGRVERLLDAHYARYAGTLDRSASARPVPPVDQRGNPISYFLAETDGRDAGVVGVTPEGDLVEWSVAGGPHADATADALLDAAEDWARTRGAIEVKVLIAPDDVVTARALGRRDYREGVPGITVMRFVSFSGFLSDVLAARHASSPGFPRLTARIRLEPGLYPQLFEPDLTIALSDAGARVDASAGGEADFTIHATATDLSEFLLGARGRWCFAFRRARVRPWTRLPQALRLLGLIGPTRPWYSPLGERR